jgi:2-dehydro-3-deoxy-D-arabinonate dehydratase
VVSAEPLDVATDLKLRITRRGKDVWETNLRSDAVAEKAPDLADWLWRGNMFPFGAYLMTGPVVAWPEGFSLRPGDQVYLTHESIGTLSNMVVN